MRDWLNNPSEDSFCFFFFSSRRRHTRYWVDWSSDVCSSDLVTKGVAYTGINIRDLKRLPLRVPPVTEQHEIVRRVEALFKLADKIEERVATATKRADKLT